MRFLSDKIKRLKRAHKPQTPPIVLIGAHLDLLNRQVLAGAFPNSRFDGVTVSARGSEFTTTIKGDFCEDFLKFVEGLK